MSDRATSVRRPCVCEVPGEFTMKIVELPAGYFVYVCVRCGRVLRIQKVRP